MVIRKPKELSNRSHDWLKFSAKVLAHIELYTVPQYGDKGEDQATEFRPEDFILQIKKYAHRHGKNSRSGQDKLDLMKIAHYAQMAFEKMEAAEDAQGK